MGEQNQVEPAGRGSSKGFLGSDHAGARPLISTLSIGVKVPMPTTRRGRFLFYRDRAMRRVRKAWKRRAFTFALPTDPYFHKAGTRGFDLSGFTVQVPLTDYDPVGTVFPPGTWSVSWLIRPSRGVWGVLISPGVYDPLRPGNHAPDARQGYSVRRVLSVPRLKHIPRTGFAGPYDPARAGDYWPFHTYPSGRINPYVP